MRRPPPPSAAFPISVCLPLRPPGWVGRFASRETGPPRAARPVFRRRPSLIDSRALHALVPPWRASSRAAPGGACLGGPQGAAPPSATSLPLLDGLDHLAVAIHKVHPGDNAVP